MTARLTRARTGLVLCCVLVLHLLSAAFTSAAAPQDVSGDDTTNSPQTLLIERATTIDVVNGRAIPDQFLLIRDQRIESIGDAIPENLPSSTRRIDASGKFIIPGLWDMHVHWYDIRSMSLFPMNGVTGVRIMAGAPFHHAWKTQFHPSGRMGPRMLVASPIVDGPKPVWPGSVVADSPARAPEIVARAKRDKADFLKVYSLLDRETYLALAAECRRNSLPFDGHVPFLVRVAEASDAGQRCMEHLYGFARACSSREEEWFERVRESLGDNRELRGFYEQRALRREITDQAMRSLDEKKLDELCRTLKANGTWQCPTLTVIRNLAHLDDPQLRENPDLQFIPTAFRSMLAPSPDQVDSEDVAHMKRVWQFNRRIIPALREHQIPILAGTDCLNPFCLPGFSLHTELELLVQAGLSPAEALQTATINPARFMQRENELGTVETGRFADLVILNQNPLDDIANTRDIHGVVWQGEWIDSDARTTFFNSLKQSP